MEKIHFTSLLLDLLWIQQIFYGQKTINSCSINVRPSAGVSFERRPSIGLHEEIRSSAVILWRKDMSSIEREREDMSYMERGHVFYGKRTYLL